MNGSAGGGGYPPPPLPPMPPMFPPPSSGIYSSPSGSGCSCAGCNGKSSMYSPNPITSMNQSVQSWYDTAIQQPLDPRLLIANVYFGGIQGTFTRSTAFGASSWIANTFVYDTTAAPACNSLHTDDALAVAEAAQWTFAHQILNVSGSNPPALSKVAFLRAGSEFEMVFDINLGGSSYTDLLLSFRDNAAVPGDFVSGSTGSIPVFKFTGSLTGIKTMKVTLKMPGTFVMGLKAVTGGNHSMFEMEWIVVQ